MMGMGVGGNMEEEINLSELFQILRKRLALIIAITFTATAIGAIVSYYYLTPSYQASTTILVNESKNNQNIVSSEATVTNETVMATYYKIIKSEAILSIVNEKLVTPFTTRQLKGMITVGGEDDQVMTLSVEDTDPVRAAKIANMTASVFENEIVKIMNVDNVSILDKAPEKGDFYPVSPKPLLNTAIATVVGLMVAVGLAFLLAYLDNTIDSEQEMEKILNIPVLGVVSAIDEPKQKLFGKVKGESLRV